MLNLKHKLPNGQIAKRRTPRAYTHVVIGEWDADSARRRFEELVGTNAELHGSNFDWYTEQSGPNAKVYDWDGTLAEVNAKALAELAGRSREQYVADMIEQDRAKMEERNEQNAGTHLLRWSQSLNAAMKGVDYFRKYHYRNVRVEQVNNGVRQ